MPEKKPKPFDVVFEFPTIYREDLEEIEKIISNDIKPDSYYIDGDDLRYKKVSDLPRDKEASVSQFDLCTSNPYISLTKTKHLGLYLKSHSENPSVIGNLHRISELIKLREKRKLYMILDQVSGITKFISLILIFLSVFVSSDAIEPIRPYKDVFITFTLFAALFYIAIILVHPYKTQDWFTRIFFQEEHKKQNLFIQYKSQIIIAVGIAIFSFLLGKLF